MAEKIQKLTREGYRDLEKKLKYMKGKVRQEIAERIRQAKEFGELGENSEYENAKSEQARVEQEIAKLEKILRTSEIIEKKETSVDKVEIGVTVVARNMEEDKVMTFEIVSSPEANPTAVPPRISDESPIGMAMVGLEKGQTARAETPLGVANYEIMEIKFA